MKDFVYSIFNGYLFLYFCSIHAGEIDAGHGNHRYDKEPVNETIDKTAAQWR